MAEPLKQTVPSKPVRRLKDPFRRQRIQGWEAPEDWLALGRQEFVNACGFQCWDFRGTMGGHKLVQPEVFENEGLATEFLPKIGESSTQQPSGGYPLP